MSKVMQAVDALKTAWKALLEIANPIDVIIDQDRIVVHLLSRRDLDQIPGKVTYQDEGEYEYPIRAEKKFAGVTFFCLMTREEFRKIA